MLRQLIYYKGYEWEWDMPNMNVFDLTQNAFLLSQHDEGEGTPVHIQLESVATLIGVTLKHNGTVGLASGWGDGTIELVDCVNLGPELSESFQKFERSVILGSSQSTVRLRWIFSGMDH